MSFFNDLFDSISFEDFSNKVCCHIIFGEALKISGNIKLDKLSEDEIVIKFKKNKVLVKGTGLCIESMARGEIEIGGNILGVEML